MNLPQVIEALLFSAQKPLTPREIASAIKSAGGEDDLAPNEVAKTSEAEVAAALEALKHSNLEPARPVRLFETAKAWRCVRGPRCAPRAYR